MLSNFDCFGECCFVGLSLTESVQYGSYLHKSLFLFLNISIDKVTIFYPDPMQVKESAWFSVECWKQASSAAMAADCSSI